MRKVRISVGAAGRDTQIEIDDEIIRDVEQFIMQQHAGDAHARLDLVRVTFAQGDDSLGRKVDTLDGKENDIEIEGLAAVVEMFEDEARRAAAEQQLAIGSFIVREHGDPEIRTLAEIVQDAKRYRAMRAALPETDDKAFGDSFRMDRPFSWGPAAIIFEHISQPRLDALADDLRKHIAAKRARADTEDADTQDESGSRHEAG